MEKGFFISPFLGEMPRNGRGVLLLKLNGLCIPQAGMTFHIALMQNETKNQGLQIFRNLLFVKLKFSRVIFEQALIFPVPLKLHFSQNPSHLKANCQIDKHLVSIH
ncbi:MAG: hypothetical protein N4A46_15545 [Schleiferiaceae bacterium]|nr:hypothetical protein [Schleiferiaceae bacterium]